MQPLGDYGPGSSPLTSHFSQMSPLTTSVARWRQCGSVPDAMHELIGSSKHDTCHIYQRPNL